MSEQVRENDAQRRDPFWLLYRLGRNCAPLKSSSSSYHCADKAGNHVSSVSAGATDGDVVEAAAEPLPHCESADIAGARSKDDDVGGERTLDVAQHRLAHPTRRMRRARRDKPERRTRDLRPQIRLHDDGTRILAVDVLSTPASRIIVEESLVGMSIMELQFIRSRHHGGASLKELLRPQTMSLTPRDYQLEIFERAKHENIIAVLGTGTGKTLIACLLIKHHLSLERQARQKRSERKLIIFLVPLVHLTLQQSMFIKNFCSAVVAVLNGFNISDSADPMLWKNILEEQDVVVVTPQILLDALSHGFISMKNFRLLIFDEAHHTKKDHPYGIIMNNFFNELSIVDRPRIFSMTASPVDSKVNFEFGVKSLEIILSSRICTAKSPTLLTIAPRPKDIIIHYDPPPAYTQTELYQKLYSICHETESLSSIFKTAMYINTQYGPWCGDRLWPLVIYEYLQRLTMNYQIDSQKESTVKIVTRSGSGSTKNDGHSERKESMKIARKKLKGVEKILQTVVPVKPKLDPMFFSPKLIILIDIVRKIFEKGQHLCIVFVTRRIVAQILNILFKELTLPGVKTEAMIGHRTTESVDLTQDLKEQISIINDFRERKFNVLIATNVAEEGLDIPDCDVVIRFDLSETLSSYIQSSGRARKRDSRMINMVERSNLKQIQSLMYLQTMKKNMDEYFDSIDEDRLILTDNVEPNPDEELYDLQINGSKYYMEPQTGARLFPSSAVPLLYRYCSSLPSEVNLTPHLDINVLERGDYICNVRLPINAPFRSISGDVCKTKKVARQMAAFNCCLELRSLNQLNEYFLPRKLKLDDDEYDRNEVGNMEDNKLFQMLVPVHIPEFWKHEERQLPLRLHCTVICLANDKAFNHRHHRPICFLSWKALPGSATMKLRTREESTNAHLIDISKPLFIDNSRLHDLTSYTLHLLSLTTNKQFQLETEYPELPFFLAPMLRSITEPTAIVRLDTSPEHIISWDEVVAGARKQTTKTDYTNICEKNLNEESVILLFGQSTSPFYLSAVHHEFRPSSQAPDWTQESKYVCVLEYYKRIWPNIEVCDDQPLFECKRFARMLNYIRAEDIANKQVERKPAPTRMLIPSLCQLSTIKASVLSMAFLFPSVYTMINAILLATELNKSLSLSLNLNFLTVAITAPSSQFTDNYERLEFLGDSFLKIATSLSVFITYPHLREDDLHILRIKLLCNKFLCSRALVLNIPGFIQSLPFTRRDWKPVGLRCHDNCPTDIDTDKSQILGRKTMADVIEAIIGAAILSGGIKTALHCVSNLGIPLCDGQIQYWSDWSKAYKPPADKKSVDEVDKEDLVELEKIIGYTFRNKDLLIEAFTHASVIDTESSCYQRLEFLGDAALEYTAVRHLFEKWSNHTPAQLTQLKAALVNNKFLSKLSVEMGLQKYVRTCSSAIVNEITTYCFQLEIKAQEGRDNYWWELSEPKILSDLIESTMGAILIDSNFDMVVIDKFFERHFKVYLETENPPSIAQHAVTGAYCTAPQNGIRVLIPRMREVEHSDDIDTFSQKASLIVHGNVLHSETGPTKKVARLSLAISVLQFIEKEPTYCTRWCTCNDYEEWEGSNIDSNDGDDDATFSDDSACDQLYTTSYSTLI